MSQSPFPLPEVSVCARPELVWMCINAHRISGSRSQDGQGWPHRNGRTCTPPVFEVSTLSQFQIYVEIPNPPCPHKERKARSLNTPPFIQRFLSHLVISHKWIELCDVHHVSALYYLFACIFVPTFRLTPQEATLLLTSTQRGISTTITHRCFHPLERSHFPNPQILLKMHFQRHIVQARSHSQLWTSILSLPVIYSSSPSRHSTRSGLTTTSKMLPLVAKGQFKFRP